MEELLSLAAAAPEWTALLTLILTIAGVGSAIAAVMYSRTSQGAIAWATSLIFFPIGAVPLYWLLGRRRFQGYVRAHRARKRELREVADRVRTRLIENRAKSQDLPLNHLAYERLTSHPFSDGNRLELLLDGEATFDSILEAVDRASSYVLIEFFIVRDDEIGRRLKDSLIARAAAGVRCHVLYDRVGSRKLSRRYVQDLRRAGVEIHPFSTTRGLPKRAQINFRNHRKIVITDGRIGFTGGLNLGDEYLGKDPDLSPWRDTHLRLEGPVVATLQMTFLEDWNWAAPETPLALDWEAARPLEDGMAALIIPSGPADDLETCALLYTQGIDSAQERIWISSPYFIPDMPTIAALQLAALRGADVRILIPEEADYAFAGWAAHSFIQELLPFGIRFFRFQKGFIHQKVMLVDRRLAAVGTANFDNRSFRLNFEVMAACTDGRFVATVEAMLERDFLNSEEISSAEALRGSFWTEFRARLARLTASIQ